MMETKFITFGRPDIGEAEIAAVTNVLRSGWLSTGEVANRFAAEFKDHLGGEIYCAPVSSCTMGLILSLMAAGIGKDDEVIVPVMTFCATANSVLAVGAKPVFVDVMSNGTIDPLEVSRSITSKTKAIIPVHYTGRPCMMRELQDIATKKGLVIIEDCAHAFGGTYKKKNLGTIGDFASFSFYPTKNITSGEGGMVITKKVVLWEKIKELSMNGMSNNAWKRYGSDSVRRYSVEYVGQKGNMSDVHAAIGLAQLRRWNEIKTKRDKIWKIYEAEYGHDCEGHSRHLYTIQVEKRDDLREFLHSKGIGTGIHFVPLHMEPAYRFLGYKVGDFPIAEQIGECTVSLPISSTMTESDAYDVVWNVNWFLNK